MMCTMPHVKVKFVAETPRSRSSSARADVVTGFLSSVARTASLPRRSLRVSSTLPRKLPSLWNWLKEKIA